MVMQGITDTRGELAFLGQARPGCTHDLAEARTDGIIQAVTDAGIETIADSAYQGAGGTVRTPIKRPQGKGHNGFEKRANSALAKLRAPVERGFAVLKRFHILDRLRISPNRATTLLHATLAIIRKRSSLARAQTEKAHCKPVPMTIWSSRTASGSFWLALRRLCVPSPRARGTTDSLCPTSSRKVSRQNDDHSATIRA
jgi:hypothetical protein